MKPVDTLRFYKTGRPDEVIQLDHLERVPPEKGEVGVRVLAAAINPADLNQLEGTYGERPDLPAIPGNEGVGVVEHPAGTFSKGDFVLLNKQAWRQAGYWKAEDLIPVGEVNDVLQFAMLRVNPATAWRMLLDFEELKEGDWVIQNASNSGVGRWVSAICARRGLRLISFVRREMDVPCAEGECRLIETPDSASHVKEIVGSGRIRLGLNAVGGESASLLMQCLCPGATLVTYGAMSRKPLRVSNGHLIFKDLIVRGFWVSRWLKEAPREEVCAMYSELAAMLRSGLVHVPIAGTYPLEKAKEALSEAMRSGRPGKILFQPSS